MGRELTALTGAVALALVVHVLHGVVHVTIPVATPPRQLAYVVVVLFAAPVAGVVVARRGHLRRGAAVVAAAGAAALAFEGLFHFVVHNADHVGHVTRDVLQFSVTAVLSTAGDLLVAGVGAWVWWTTAE